MKPALICVFLILSFYGCKKYDTEVQGEGNTLVEGTVLDITTDKPVANATVLLQAHRDGMDWGGYGTIKEYVSDAQGRFAFRFESDDEHTYFINAFKGELYFDADNPLGIDNAKKNEGLKIHIPPSAFVKFHIREVDSIKGANLGIGNSICTNGYLFNAYHIDTSTICKYRGNTEVDIVWGTVVNGEQIRGGGMYYLPAFDTTLIDIYF